jgi:hypothetical protein
MENEFDDRIDEIIDKMQNEIKWVKRILYGMLIAAIIGTALVISVAAS